MNYFLEVINLNKHEFSCTDDIKEAIGPILSELDGEKSNDNNFITELCDKFLKILTRYNQLKFGHINKHISKIYLILSTGNLNSLKNFDNSESVKQLAAPIQIGNSFLVDDSKNKKEISSMFDLKKENITVNENTKFFFLN